VQKIRDGAARKARGEEVDIVSRDEDDLDADSDSDEDFY
jgi:hypothetical protein